MRISNEQLKILDSLVIERLKDNEVNETLASTFRNEKNSKLARVITSLEAFEKDREGSTAYYFVKSTDGIVLMYFSLKCGELFTSLNKEKMEIAKKVVDYIEILKTSEIHQPARVEEANNYLLNNIAVIKEIGIERIQYFAQKQVSYSLDINKEDNQEVSRVLETYPAIEIVEFCANDNARQKWLEYGFPNKKKMGECIFWRRIVPILKSVQDIIGCEYVYLFAADASKDRFLANYYKVALNFEYADKLGTNKPHYDFMCYFLLQKISKLDKGQEEFYNSFNPDEDMDDMV